MPPDPETLLTVGEIARRLACELHQIEYIIRSREVRPRSRAGNVLVYDQDAVDFIRAERERIDRGAPDDR